MGKCRVLAVTLGVICALNSLSYAQIYVSDSIPAPAVTRRVRVSVKIMNDAAGRRPADGFYRSDEQILAVFDDCNAALAAMNVDWRLELVEIRDVKGASEWFGPFDCDLKGEFEAHARAQASTYFYRTNAINVYVISELIGCGGYCSIPSSGDEAIIINNRVGILNWSLGWLHEIGHYFGLQHTYQCPTRPCQSDHNVCTGAGSERRDCPDACPDLFNIMSGHEDLVVGQAVFSPCQLSEIAYAMRSNGGVRAKVVEQVASTGGGTDQCVTTAPTVSTGGSSALSGTPADANAGLPRAPTEPVTNSGGTPVGTTADACVDVTSPEVLRIDPQFLSNSLRVNGVVIEFSEPIDMAEVQNGVDIAITLDTTPLNGTIVWRDNNRTLAWTSSKAMPAGQYGIFLTSADETDFQDIAGNVLRANTDGYFAIGFSLDQKGQLVLPTPAACGAGGLFAGLMVAPLIAVRRQFRRRG